MIISVKEVTMRQRIKNFFSGVLTAGIINVLLGLFYWVIVGGIPYQDAPLNLQIEYTANMRVGDTLFFIGALLCFIGIIGKIVLYFFRRKTVSNETLMQRV